MSNKKLFAIVLSAIILTSVVTVGAYKIFTKNSVPPSITNSNPNFESIVDSIDYSENLLDSNQVYKEKFSEDLYSQGKWIPIKSSQLIKELTGQQDDSPVIQNVSNENNEQENTNSAQNIATDDNETFVEEVSATNLTSPNNNANVKEVTETKTVTEKIIYIWQPNECNEAGWNPYSNGHWEFTSCGWVWASDYRWGRHCYNYGRWVWTSFAGWVWMPGGRWAPNWVTWRQCGNYNGGCYIGWYPTCPVLYWQNYQSHLVVCNSHFTSNPIHWTVVNQKDLTKKINPKTKVNPELNGDILKNSGKVKVVNTLAIDDTKVKYNGPNVNVISEVTNTKITPKSIEIPKNIDKNSAGTKLNEVSDPVVKVSNPKTTTTKKTNVISDGDDLIGKIRNTNVSNPFNNETNSPKTTTPIKTTEPIKTTTPVNPTVKTDKTKTTEPVKTTTPKSTTTPKQETPKQDPPKQNPPKQDPPKQNPPKQDPPKYDPPKYEPPVYNPPPPKQESPKQDPPKQDPPKQDPPRQDPPPKKDDGKKSD